MYYNLSYHIIQTEKNAPSSLQLFTERRTEVKEGANDEAPHDWEAPQTARKYKRPEDFWRSFDIYILKKTSGQTLYILDIFDISFDISVHI